MLSFKVRNSSIEAMAVIIVLGFFGFFLNTCEDENPKERSYPRVRTNAVSNITDKGATFNAEIYSAGSELMINHGFVWGEGESPTLNNNNKILLGTHNPDGAYSAEIVTTLSKDVEYTVKAFVQTVEHVVYGLPVKFKSLGSGAPVIYGFKPDSAAWLDTLQISGKNFSLNLRENIVKLNQILCTVLSATDTSINVAIVTDVRDLKNIVSVELSGNIAIDKRDTFRLIPPVIKDFNPKKAFWSDTVIIKGHHFKTFNFKPANFINLGPTKCKIVGQVSDTIFSVIIPDELATLTSDLRMNINGITVSAKLPFELLPPYFNFSPATGTWGNIITLTGRFNRILSRTKIYFNINEAEIASNSLKTIQLKVPYSLTDIKSLIVYDVDPFLIKSNDTFRLSSPLIYSFMPLLGPSGTLVTIKGKYFDVFSQVVKFGNVPATISSMNDSVIVAIVPPGIDGDVKISIVGRSQTVVTTSYFDVTNPKVNNVSPVSGTFNDEITINGEGLISPYGVTTVSFDDIPANIKSISSTSIIVNVPLTIDSIPRAIKVTSGFETVSSTQMFVLSPQQITSVLPAQITAGTDVTISGTGFNPELSGNTVLWDIYPLVIKSASKTEIVATYPQFLPRGSFGIKVIVGGYSRTSVQKVSFDSQWLRINAPKIPTTLSYAYIEGIANYGKSIKSQGYICSEAGGVTYRFDPISGSWTKLNIPSMGLHVKMGEVACKDTFYLISGNYGGYSMFALNQDIETWRDVPLAPSITDQPGIAFSLNNNLYFGLDFYNRQRSFYKCEPGNNYSWTQLDDFPSATVQFATYFSLLEKGYVLFSDNSLWQFNPDLLQWTRKVNFPGPARKLACSFVIVDKAFIGLGQSMVGNNAYNDLWTYDPVADSWTLSSNIPIARHSAVAFSIANKAYIGFGLKMGDYAPTDLYDFYEFDPNYPTK